MRLVTRRLPRATVAEVSDEAGIGQPTHWVTAGTRLATLTELLHFIGSRTKKGCSLRETRHTRAEFWRNESFAPEFSTSM